MNWGAGRHSTIALAVVAVALLSYFLMNHLMLRVLILDFDTRGFLKTFVYLAWITCAFLVFIGVLFTARPFGVILLLLVTGFSVGTNYAYDTIAKQEITPDYMEWMVQELGHAGAAWAEFRPEILAATGKAVLFVAAFFALRAVIQRSAAFPPDLLRSGRVRIAALGAFLGLHGVGMALQPSYAVAETNVLIFGIPALVTVTPVEREKVALAPERPRVEKIFFVVDESVAYDMYRRVVAPVVAHFPAIDFGRAASIAACSAASNALLRWGVFVSRVESPGYDPRANPTIWEYAKNAGFKTVLIDGQSKGATQNLMNVAEFALVDEFIPADIGIETDVRIAEMLTRRAAVPGREFVYVVKRGSHFAYEGNYPAGLVDIAAPRGEKYAASVAYATTRFFEALKSLSLANVLLLYTSDHGQNLDSRAVHCSGKNDPREYAVPLVAMSGTAEVAAELREGANVMRNHASHLNAFGTLLNAMGYPRMRLEALYGATLTGPPGDYIWVDSWLPHPTRRHAAVKFRKTKECPGCGAG